MQKALVGAGQWQLARRVERQPRARHAAAHPDTLLVADFTAALLGKPAADGWEYFDFAGDDAPTEDGCEDSLSDGVLVAEVAGKAVARARQ